MQPEQHALPINIRNSFCLAQPSAPQRSNEASFEASSNPPLSIGPHAVVHMRPSLSLSGLEIVPPLEQQHREGEERIESHQPSTFLPLQPARQPAVYGIDPSLVQDPAAKRKSQQRAGAGAQTKATIQQRPRDKGRFVCMSRLSHQELTEAQILPLMRYCRATAARMLNTSTYQLTKACSRLKLKWPRWPEEPTPEDDKAESRKKNKVYIPIKAKAVFYAERQACGATRFHELRLSADGRAVYERWGRPGVSANYGWYANRKVSFSSREEALAFCRQLRTTKLCSEAGWAEKKAPVLPGARPKSKRKALLGAQQLHKWIREQRIVISQLSAANRGAVPGTHPPAALEREQSKLDSLRSRYLRAMRRAKGLVTETKTQRQKLAAMHADNAAAPGTHAAEALSAAVKRLRLLSRRYSSRLHPNTFSNPHPNTPHTSTQHAASRSSGNKRKVRDGDAAPLAPDAAQLADGSLHVIAPKRTRARADSARAPPTWPSMPPPVPPVPLGLAGEGGDVARAWMWGMGQVVWCSGPCVRLRQPWCSCDSGRVLAAPGGMPPEYSGGYSAWTQPPPLPGWGGGPHAGGICAASMAALAGHLPAEAACESREARRGFRADGLLHGGWPFGGMEVRFLATSGRQRDARRWPLLCLPDGTKLAPTALGVRAAPSLDRRNSSHGAGPAVSGVRLAAASVVPGALTNEGGACVATPLYSAREVFELVVDAGVAPALRRKRWERLWRTSSGKSTSLMQYALWLPGGGTESGRGGGWGVGEGMVTGASSARRGREGGAQSDVLVGFQGIVRIVKAVGDEVTWQRMQHGIFLQQPQPPRSRAKHPKPDPDWAPSSKAPLVLSDAPCGRPGVGRDARRGADDGPEGRLGTGRAAETMVENAIKLLVQAYGLQS